MIKSFGFSNLKDNFLVHFTFLLGAIFLLVGKKPPFGNEYAYLLRLITTYNSDFLLNDATFAFPANEHWLFNHLFGILTLVFSIEFISWSGRIVCWIVLLFAVMRLAKQWEIPLWMVTASILLWLCRGQSIIGDEWIFGTFEAKCVAYICLLFALDGFSREKVVYPAILLGLTLSFHPAVGLWGGLATGLALLFCRWNLAKLLTVGGITAAFSLPGVVPLFTEISNTASIVEWKFIVLVRLPNLLDPFSWSLSKICLVYLQLVFCLIFYYFNSLADRRKFLTGFLSALGLFFTIGFFLRGFEQYELLRFMPTRLFPVFAPLFFFFSFAEAYRLKLFAPPFSAVAAVGFACLLLWQSPLTTASDQLVQTYQTWRSNADDAAKSFVWLRENTPNGVTVIAPPWRQDFWYLSHRAQAVSSGYTPFAGMQEWRERLEILSGESLLQKGRREHVEMSAFYHALTTDTINEIAGRCRAEYLVSESEYPYPIVFTSGKSKVYRLDPQP